jgi:hypothetical protein
MNRVIGLAVVAAGALSGCAYYGPPSPYAYFNVPCTPAGVMVVPGSSGTVTPIQPPANANPSAAAPNSVTTAPPPTAVGNNQCIAVVPTYTAYPTYYYYQGYYGPPIYSSVIINNPFH